MNTNVEGFTSILRRRLRDYGSRPFAEFEGEWYSGDDVTRYIDRIDELLTQAGVADGEAVGIVVRNRLPHAAIILGLIAGNRSFSMIYAFQSSEAMAKDIARLRLSAVIAGEEDWTPPTIGAAAHVGSVGIVIELRDSPATFVAGLSSLGSGPFADTPPQASVDVLTSGTTGPPKRIQIPMPVLERAAISASSQQVASADEPPDLVFWPFGGIGGVCQLASVLYSGKRMVLLEKFTVEKWVSAIEKYKIARVGVQPTVIRMVLAAEVPPARLSSLSLIFGGSAPIDPDTRDRFEKVYDVPVVWAYGATEFAGTLLSWTPDLHREFGSLKRGSIGRPVPGSEIRITEVDTGVEVPVNVQGYLEARIQVIGSDWIRTTDLASIDEDGFVTLHGRGDGVINRGGFKVLPETVVRTLLQHDAVLEATVIGIADERLGEVPVAVVELVSGAPEITEDDLKAFVRVGLPAHHIPAQIRIVDQLPRTQSLKVSLVDVRAMFA